MISKPLIFVLLGTLVLVHALPEQLGKIHAIENELENAKQELQEFHQLPLLSINTLKTEVSKINDIACDIIFKIREEIDVHPSGLNSNVQTLKDLRREWDKIKDMMYTHIETDSNYLIERWISLHETGNRLLKEGSSARNDDWSKKFKLWQIEKLDFVKNEIAKLKLTLEIIHDMFQNFNSLNIRNLITFKDNGLLEYQNNEILRLLNDTLETLTKQGITTSGNLHTVSFIFKSINDIIERLRNPSVVISLPQNYVGHNDIDKQFEKEVNQVPEKMKTFRNLYDNLENIRHSRIIDIDRAGEDILSQIHKEIELHQDNKELLEKNRGMLFFILDKWASMQNKIKQSTESDAIKFKEYLTLKTNNIEQLRKDGMSLVKSQDEKKKASWRNNVKLWQQDMQTFIEVDMKLFTSLLELVHNIANELKQSGWRNVLIFNPSGELIPDQNGLKILFARWMEMLKSTGMEQPPSDETATFVFEIITYAPEHVEDIVRSLKTPKPGPTFPPIELDLKYLEKEVTTFNNWYPAMENNLKSMVKNIYQTGENFLSQLHKEIENHKVAALETNRQMLSFLKGEWAFLQNKFKEPIQSDVFLLKKQWMQLLTYGQQLSEIGRQIEHSDNKIQILLWQRRFRLWQEEVNTFMNISEKDYKILLGLTMKVINSFMLEWNSFIIYNDRGEMMYRLKVIKLFFERALETLSVNEKTLTFGNTTSFFINAFKYTLTYVQRLLNFGQDTASNVIRASRSMEGSVANICVNTLPQMAGRTEIILTNGIRGIIDDYMNNKRMIN